jgi:hypothetical protein
LHESADLPQQHIAGCVTAGIIDNFELVQIQVQQRASLVCLGRVQNSLEEALKTSAVVDSSESIVDCLMAQLLNEQPLIGDIPKDQHGPSVSLASFKDRRRRIVDKEFLAIAANQ